jgi:hypothetical protein
MNAIQITQQVRSQIGKREWDLHLYFNVTIVYEATGCPQVKLSLLLTKHQTVKMYRGVNVELHVFLISVLYGDEWSASQFSGERILFIHWLEVWMSTRADLDSVLKRINPISAPAKN